jgi:hypothetical protein
VGGYIGIGFQLLESFLNNIILLIDKMIEVARFKQAIDKDRFQAETQIFNRFC